MTIKHQDKNISAEIDVTQLFDIVVQENNGEITGVKLTRKDFYNDTNKTTYDLMDYFYTEQEIDNFVKIHLVVYDSFSQLPQTNGISAGKSNYIYLVPFNDPEGIKEGIYEEYVWVKIKNSDKYRTNESDHNDYVLDGDHYNYESLGSTEIDLSPIRQDILDLQNNKINKTDIATNLTTNDDTKILSAKQGKLLQDNKVNKTDIATNLTTNDDTKVLSAKQGKLLQDNKVNKTDIATNLTTDDDTKVLSAKQGKSLQDNKISKTDIATNLTTNDDTKVLSAKQGKLLQDNKVNKTDIATNLTTNDDTKVLSAKQGKILEDNKIDKTSIADDLTTNDATQILSAKQGKILRDNVEEIIDDLNEEELFILSNKNIGQTGDQINLKALFYGEYTPTQQLSLVSQNSLANNLTVNSNGFEVISGDGFSITNNGGSLSNNDHVECTIPINLSSNTVYINFKCKSNDGTTALYGDIDSHGFNSEYNTGMFIDSTGLEFFDSTASLPNNLNLNDWIDVKVEITPTSQKVYINDTLQITKAMRFDSTAFNNAKYFCLWAPSVDFSIKDFYIEVNDVLQTSSGCFLSTNYTCIGAGKKEFVAKYGTVVSETYEVIDALVVADEVSDFNIESGDLTLSDGVFTKTENGSQYLLNPTSPTLKRGWNSEVTVEFEVVTQSTLSISLSQSNQGLFGQRMSNLGANTGDKVKIVYDGTTITPYVNGVEKTQYKVTVTHTALFGISVTNIGAFKNMCVY